MELIEEINIPNVTVNQIGSRSWMHTIPVVPNNDPPVTLQLGFPIVELPGCVETHQDNKIGANRLPLDRDLVNDDPNGVTILCPHGEYPSYNAMNFEPERVIPTVAAPPPPVAPPAPEIPDTGKVVPQGKKVPCPGPGNLRVGDTTQTGDERVVGHKLSDDGKICETLYEPTTIVEKFLPPVNQAATVTALAVVATAGAAATPLLIRIIRPAIKKLWTTIQKKFGKNVKQLTRAEIKTNKYREKKGLPPIKKK